MEQDIKLELMKCGLLCESDENLAIYAEMIQHEQARRRSVANANRKLDRLKDYMEEFHLHFINGETGEILENITIC